MTEDQARELATIIKMRDDLADWIESFQLGESAKYANLTMEIGLRDDDGHGTGWEDEWAVNRLLAIEWFHLGVEMCNGKLRAAGIDASVTQEGAANQNQ